MSETPFVLLIGAALLVIVGICQPLAARLKLPPPVLLGVVGVALGTPSLVLFRLGLSGEFANVADIFVNLPISSTTYIYVFLPLLVFQAGLAADVRGMIEDAAPILLLAIVATLITAATIGLALWPLADVSLVACLLLGAVVSTTDPAAVIDVFRDVGAPARLIRLAEGEALLNDAAAIVLFAVLFGLIVSGRQPDILWGVSEFSASFVGGGLFGLLAGRAMLGLVSWLRDDRLAEATLTLALAYGVFVAAEQFVHVSGVVAVLAAGLALSAWGRSTIAPYNWSFLTDLWDQVAYWARSLIFILAAILVPRLLGSIDGHDLLLLAVLVVTAFATRLLVLFVLLPPLEELRLSQPMSSAYKLAMTWGGLRGALTLVLALAATEHAALGAANHRFIAVLATGFVMFTLFVNGTTLRPVIALLGLNRLSPRNQVLRDRVLALSYANVTDTVRTMAREHALDDAAIRQVVAPYRAWIVAADARDAAEQLSDRDRLAIALVALANQEHALVLEARADRIASTATVQALLRNVEALIEGARTDGRIGYRRAAGAALRLPVAFRAAYFLYRHLGIIRFVADRLADHVELLLVTRLLVDKLLAFNDRRLGSLFGPRIAKLTGEIIRRRRQRVGEALDAVRRQYPDYAAALEVRFLRQSALRQEMVHYQALFEEGLIPRELFDDLERRVANARAGEMRPHFDIGLDTRRLVDRLDMLSGLDEKQLDRVAGLLRPRFTVPGERIIRAGDRADACFFIASGEVEVRQASRHIRLGGGDVFGELALLTGRRRQADVVALTYCRLLVLRRADFQAFLFEHPDAQEAINRVAAERLAMNQNGTDTGGLPPKAA